MKATREDILAYRRTIGSLDERIALDESNLRTVAWAGLQDSMPRAAVLSVNARVDQTPADVWDDDAFVQVWGPRFSAFVVPADDWWVFTVGRHPTRPAAVQRASDLAERIADLLGDQEMTYADTGRALGVNPNALRYATTTGRVLIRWTGAGKPTIRAVDPPSVDVVDARCELARRYLHVFGPSLPDSFARWAGVKPADAREVFDVLAPELHIVETPLGAATMLETDAAQLGTSAQPADARLLPSGDTYYLLQGDDRSLLVEDQAKADRLWTSRVWPGAVLVEGEVVGTWRRAGTVVTIELWERLPSTHRSAVEREATSLPLPDVGAISVDWVL